MVISLDLLSLLSLALRSSNKIGNSGQVNSAPMNKCFNKVSTSIGFPVAFQPIKKNTQDKPIAASTQMRIANFNALKLVPKEPNVQLTGLSGAAPG